MSTPIVIVVRDPDASNWYEVFDGEVETYDIDCGNADLRDRDEFLEWADSHLTCANEMEARRPLAADFIRDTVLQHAQSGWQDDDIQNADSNQLLAIARADEEDAE